MEHAGIGPLPPRSYLLSSIPRSHDCLAQHAKEPAGSKACCHDKKSSSSKLLEQK